MVRTLNCGPKSAAFAAVTPSERVSSHDISNSGLGNNARLRFMAIFLWLDSRTQKHSIKRRECNARDLFKAGTIGGGARGRAHALDGRNEESRQRCRILVGCD